MLGKKNKIAADINSRQKVLWLNPQALIVFMTARRWVINKNELPEDTKYHHVFWSPERNVWGLVVTSKEFKPILAGSPMPELPMMEFRYWNPEKDGPIE